MKKRPLTLICVLCLLAALSVVFGACQAHEHTWTDAWTSDDTYHWHSATCAHTDLVGDKAEHTWNAGEITTAATATAEGVLTKACTVCGRTKTEAIPATGEPTHTHSYTSVVTAPTCTEQGFTTHTCECGEVVVDTYVDALGHNVATWTSNNDGTHTGTCANAAHDVTVACAFTPAVTAPTCTEQGYTTYTCVCGHSYRDDYESANGHSYKDEFEHNDSYHWREATCAHTTEKADYAQHDYTSVVVTPPTCTEQGYTTYTCDCGYSYQGDPVDPTGHSVREWIKTETNLIDPTACQYAITYEGECGTCGVADHKTETLTQHSYYWAITTPATCQADGEKTKICNNPDCNDHVAHANSETMTYSDPDAHEWEIDNEASTRTLTAYKCTHTGCLATKKTVTTVEDNVDLSGSDLNDFNEVEFPEATLGFDQGVKDTLAQNANVSISASTLKAAAKEQAIRDAQLSEEDLLLLGNNPIYSFTVTTDEELDTLGGTATVRIKYTLEEGQNPDEIVVWYLADGKLEAVPATYSLDANGEGYITFTTTHFSCYAPAQLSPAEYCYAFGHSKTNLRTVEPTCTVGGYTICLHCGQVIEFTAPTGHNWHSSVTLETSCSTNGTMHFACEDCDAAYDTVIPATGHYYVLHDHKNATCREAGEDTFRCTWCEDSYTVTLPQTRHNHTVHTVAATCTAAGYTEKSCVSCGETLTTNYVAPLGHAYASAWSTAEEGHYHVCNVCGERGEIASHTPGAAATEQSAQICTVCEYVITPPLAHVHSLTAVEAVAQDCTHNGNIAYYTCECGKWFLDADAQQLITDHSAVIVLAKGHTPEGIDPVAPTCTEVGFTAGIQCSTCQTLLSGRKQINATGHIYSADVTAPTCTEGGFTVYTCACGDTYTDNQTIPLGHNEIATVKAPTCTEGGYTTFTCTRCNQTRQDAQTGALGHKLAEALGHDENGHWSTCVRCAAKLNEAAHTPDHTEATVEHGVTCTACGYVIEEILGHTHTVSKAIEGRESTCTASGLRAYYVCACGTWFEDEACTKVITNTASVVIPAKGHSLQTVPATESTCMEHGYTEGKFCTTCQKWLAGHTELPLGDHDYEVSVTEPTCTEEGYEERLCNNCGLGEVTNFVPALGHNFTNGVCERCGEQDGTVVEKEIVYTYEDREESTIGTSFVVRYEFYADFTVYGIGEVYDADGKLQGKQEAWATWGREDDLVVVYFTDEDSGEEDQEYFTVNEDGKTLSAYASDEEPNQIVYYFEADEEDTWKLIYRFYDNGMIQAIEGYYDENNEFIVDFELWAEWIEKEDGKIAIVYEGEEVEYFTVSDDGYTLILYECPHEHTERNERPATCTQGGGGSVVCLDCGRTLESFGSAPLGHDYVNGVCTRCGEVGSGEMQAQYAYVEKTSDFMMHLYFYSDFTVKVEQSYRTESGEWIAGTTYAKWEWRDGRVVLLHDALYGMTFTVGRDNYTLSLYIPGEQPGDCKHEETYQMASVSTCTKGGTVTTYCAKCKIVLSEYTTPAPGHDFVDGVCKRCGEIEGTEDTEKREVRYSFKQEEDGKSVYIEFYTDGTVCAFVEITSGGDTVKDEAWAEWSYKGEFLEVIENGMVVLQFIVNDDDSLTMVEPTKPEDCDHANAVTTRREPTCTEAGESMTSCPDCHTGWGGPIPALGHDFADGVCKRCGLEQVVETPDKEVIYYYYDEVTMPPFMNIEFYNDYTIKVIVTDVTADGAYFETHLYGTWYQKNEQEICADYNGKTLWFIVVDGNILKPNDNVTPGDGCKHENSLTTVVDPTCTEEGRKMSTCGDCQTGWTEFIPALGHSYDETGVCIRCGLQEGDDELQIEIEEMLIDLEECWKWYLENGAKDLPDYESYKKVYHEVYDAIKSATSFADIEKQEDRIAKIFDEIEDLLQGDECAHDSVNVQVVAPTCTDEGYEEVHCIYCGASWTTNFVPALGHQFDDTGRCIVCHVQEGGSDLEIDIKLTQEDVSARWEHYLNKTEAPKLEGFANLQKRYQSLFRRIGVVTSVGELTDLKLQIEQVFNEIEMLLGNMGGSEESCAHNMVTERRLEATCTASGEEINRCTECGITQIVLLPIRPHSFDEKGTCVVCGKMNADSTECSHPNIYVSDRKDATCQNEGYANYICPDCTFKYTQILPPLGHAYDESGRCQNCGDCMHQSCNVTEIAPGCTQSGTKQSICEACGYTWNERISPTGHDYDEKGFCTRCSLPRPTVLYVFTMACEIEVIVFEFNSDHTVYGKETGFDENGNVIYSNEVWANWDLIDGQVVLMIDGEQALVLNISEDGKTLTRETNTPDPAPDPLPVPPSEPDVGLREEYRYSADDKVNRCDFYFYADGSARIESFVWNQSVSGWMMMPDATGNTTWFIDEKTGLLHTTLNGVEVIFEIGADKSLAPVGPTVPNFGGGDVGSGDGEADVEKPEEDVYWDFGGEEVVILLPENATANWDMKDPEDMADVINCEVFERNRYVEEKLNVSLSFTMIPADQYQAHVANAALAGTNEYDFVSYDARQVTGLIQKGGIYADLRAAENLDLEAEWWNARYNESAGILGRQYTAAGDITLSMYDQMSVVFYNRELMKDCCEQDLFDLVLSGEWTLDALMQYTEMGYADLNGNGITDAEDRFGLLGVSGNCNAFGFAQVGGFSFVNYDEDNGTMYLELSDGMPDLMAALISLWESPAAYEANANEVYSSMATGKSLFLTESLNRAALNSELKASSAAIGVLPLPKYSLDQIDYSSGVAANHNVIAVIGDSVSDKVAAVLNTMGEYNHENLKPAYVAELSKWLATSEQDQILLEITVDSIDWDFVSVYEGALGNPLTSVWVKSFRDGGMRLTSYFAGKEGELNKNLEMLVSCLQN